MTKNEFIKLLKLELERHNIDKVTDILADYEEHFEHALASGKTESEISTKLGTPVTIAKSYETEAMISKVKDTSAPFDFKFALNVLGRLIIIAPFNFLFLCIPGVILFSLIASGWILATATAASSLIPLAIGFAAGIMLISGWLTTAIISGSLGLLALSVALFLLMFFVTKNFILFLINYLQWNLRFILQKQGGL